MFVFFRPYKVPPGMEDGQEKLTKGRREKDMKRERGSGPGRKGLGGYWHCGANSGRRPYNWVNGQITVTPLCGGDRVETASSVRGRNPAPKFIDGC